MDSNSKRGKVEGIHGITNKNDIDKRLQDLDKEKKEKQRVSLNLNS